MSAPFSFTAPKLSQVMEIISGARFKGPQPVNEVILRTVKFPKIKTAEPWQQWLVVQIKNTQCCGKYLKADGTTDDFVFHPEEYGGNFQSKDLARELWMNFISEKNPAVAGFTFGSKKEVIIELKSTLKLPDISATAKTLAQELQKKGDYRRYNYCWDTRWGA